MPSWGMGSSRWLAGFQQELAAGTCCWHNMGLLQIIPQGGWGVLVEQLAWMQPGVAGCVSSSVGCASLGVSALGTADSREVFG